MSVERAMMVLVSPMLRPSAIKAVGSQSSTPLLPKP